MACKRNIIMRIFPKNYNYIMKDKDLDLCKNIIDKFKNYQIESYSNTFENHSFIIINKDNSNLGIFLTNYIIDFIDNTFQCSCQTHRCEHIGFIILFFSGIYGLKSYLSLGYLDNQSYNLFDENLSISLNLEQ